MKTKLLKRVMHSIRQVSGLIQFKHGAPGVTGTPFSRAPLEQPFPTTIYHANSRLGLHRGTVQMYADTPENNSFTMVHKGSITMKPWFVYHIPRCKPGLRTMSHTLHTLPCSMPSGLGFCQHLQPQGSSGIHRYVSQDNTLCGTPVCLSIFVLTNVVILRKVKNQNKDFRNGAKYHTVA